MPKLSDLMERARQRGQAMTMKEARECISRGEDWKFPPLDTATLEAVRQFLLNWGK